MIKNKRSYIALCVLVLCFSLSQLTTQLDINEVDISGINFEEIHTSTLYYDILIDDLTPNNWTWAKNQGYCTGTGTENDPFTFYNHIFEYNNGTGYSIAIMNSRKYFKFEQCIMRYAPNSSAGLYLYNTTNGVFQDNDFYENSVGLIINECSNTTFTFDGWNHISDNHEGIIVNNSNNLHFECVFDQYTAVLSLLISNNENTGLLVLNSNYNTFSDLWILDNGGNGVILNYSHYNRIKDILLSNNQENGITLFLCHDNNITSSLDLGYTIHQSVIEGNDMSGVNMVMSSNNRILDVEFGHNRIAEIYLEDSSNNTIERNSEHYKDYLYETFSGIMIDSSNYNKITENNFDTDNYGLFLLLSSYNEIIGNTFSNNNGSGMAIYSSFYNSIYNNKLESNQKHGIEVISSLFNNVYDNKVNGNSGSGIFLEYCQFNRIFKNVATSNSIGIQLSSSNENTIVGNSLLRNGQCIAEINCEDNIIIDNECSEKIDIIFILFVSGLGLSIAANVILFVFLLRKRRREA